MVNGKGKTIAGLVFKILWLILALVLYIVGLNMFIAATSVESGDVLGMYFAWGGLCCICTISTVLSNAFAAGKKGARDGANHYTVQVMGMVT